MSNEDALFTWKGRQYVHVDVTDCERPQQWAWMSVTVRATPGPSSEVFQEDLGLPIDMHRI